MSTILTTAAGLVDTHPSETIGHVVDALCFIQELQVAQREMHLGPQSTTGLYFILKCCTDALDHAEAEIDARGLMPEKASNPKD